MMFKHLNPFIIFDVRCSKYFYFPVIQDVISQITGRRRRRRKRSTEKKDFSNVKLKKFDYSVLD